MTPKDLKGLIGGKRRWFEPWLPNVQCRACGEENGLEADGATVQDNGGMDARLKLRSAKAGGKWKM
jgi:hypothetical protein